ncbi:MAG: IS110 family transposase [Oligoflexia bacterium]|nr:IS110 family transposase [Oligoflexia bacterium]
MEVLFDIVAGVDVHKDFLSISVITGGRNGEEIMETWECSTFTDDLATAGKKILSLGAKHVAMESTGVYWRPVYNVWNSMGIIITLANASHVKNVPGRKTDPHDSRWIAKLHRCGLIRGSYIPEVEFQELRALTRHRRSLITDLAKVKNRTQKILEDGNIKLGSVLSDVFGVAGYAIVTALANGEIDPDKLADLVVTNVKAPRSEIRKSLIHTLKGYQVLLLQELLRQYMSLQNLIDSINKEIDEKMTKHQPLIEKLDAVPGIDVKIAQDIIAEATTKMENFKDAKTFAAWAGVAPGNNESGGKKKV